MSERVAISSYRRKRYRAPGRAGMPAAKRVALPYQLARPRSFYNAYNAAARGQQIYGRPGLQEVKSMDVVVASGNMVAVGAVAANEPNIGFTGLTEINMVQQGALVSQRIGNKIVLKSIQCNMLFGMAPAAANAATFRCCLVYDRQTNGAFPALVDVLADTTTAGAVAVTNFSGINIANKSRFQMIRDEFISLDPGYGSQKEVTWYCKGRWDCEYGTNAGNVGDFKTGAVYFICYYCLQVGAVPTMVICRVRCRYFD